MEIVLLLSPNSIARLLIVSDQLLKLTLFIRNIREEVFEAGQRVELFFAKEIVEVLLELGFLHRGIDTLVRMPCLVSLWLPNNRFPGKAGIEAVILSCSMVLRTFV